MDISVKSNSWRDTILGDLFKIKHGYAFKGEYFSDSGQYILLTPGNFSPDGGIKLKGEKEKHYTGTFPEEYLLSKGDLIVVMTDLTQGAAILGSPAFVPKNHLFLHNQRLGKIYNISSDIDIVFLYYLFNTNKVREQIKGSATGATVRHTAPERVYLVKVILPPLNIQHKIAAILSAYDDLIENNLRRIKILEEMAQNLYREWFVNFRFPGHEQTCFVDSPLGHIPEGWEVKKLKDVLELRYGKALKKSDRNKGNVPVFGSSGIVGYHDRPLVQGPGIVVGRKGNVGSIFWSDDAFYPIDTVYFVETDMPLRYLLYDLQNKNFINNDAAVPGLNRNQAYSLETLVPSKDVLNSFCKVVDQIEGQALLLKKISYNLSQTRDLLLPKLISGELDVSDLNITLQEVVKA